MIDTNRCLGDLVKRRLEEHASKHDKNGYSYIDATAMALFEIVLAIAAVLAEEQKAELSRLLTGKGKTWQVPT